MHAAPVAAAGGVEREEALRSGEQSYVLAISENSTVRCGSLARTWGSGPTSKLSKVRMTTSDEVPSIDYCTGKPIMMLVM
jgi:hypothetical protein